MRPLFTLFVLMGCISSYPKKQTAKNAPRPHNVWSHVSVAEGDFVCGVTKWGRGICWQSWGTMEYARDLNQALFRRGQVREVHISRPLVCATKPDGHLSCAYDARKFDAPTGPFANVSTHRHASCGISSANRAVCCTYEPYDVLSKRVQVHPKEGTYRSVAIAEGWSLGSAYQYGACAAKTTGGIDCWYFGRSSRGATPPKDFKFSPTLPKDKFVKIELGMRHGCGITESDRVKCWGFDGAGRASPPRGEYVDIALGDTFSCGLKKSGLVRCWGEIRGLQDDWKKYPADKRYRQISANGDRACGVEKSGRISCWGKSQGRDLVPNSIVIPYKSGKKKRK